ncbi:hypothetical protein WICPIJ_001522 [Wickerhamomyces pijperi]|uniref:Secreted protein n=1 Tax=Wickerhamomyces pijperi TaxID=599730 RepID=A0A9P8QBI7_WICPI|nr:hypothetical protein WICPIJ_001522 [Wickerhamomyces pijperi]
MFFKFLELVRILLILDLRISLACFDDDAGLDFVLFGMTLPSQIPKTPSNDRSKSPLTINPDSAFDWAISNHLHVLLRNTLLSMVFNWSRTSLF